MISQIALQTRPSSLVELLVNLHAPIRCHVRQLLPRATENVSATLDSFATAITTVFREKAVHQLN